MPGLSNDNTGHLVVTKIRSFSSLCDLSVLCVSVVSPCCRVSTTETQSSQRTHGEEHYFNVAFAKGFAAATFTSVVP
jgi:hypothetical protein